MSELAPKTYEGERQQSPLTPQSREFTSDDVGNIQDYLEELRALSVTDGADYSPSESSLYDKLTEGSNNTENEPLADEGSFDKTIATLLAVWGERAGLPANSPQSLAEATNLFAQNPRLNAISPIHFQGGAEYASSRFVHVATGRAMGKHREQADQRYYINPSADKMGYVVEQLAGAALEAKVPLYFKFVNVATGDPDQRTLARTDRIVIYASNEQTNFVENLLEQISEETPEAFKGREVAGFGETLSDGMAKADNVTSEQNERFKGHSEGTSFNDLRSKLIYEATLDVTRDLISLPHFASVKIGNQTIQEIFTVELSKAISKHKADTVITKNDPELLQAVRLGLSAKRLEESGKYTANAIRSIQTAVAKTARDVLPAIQPSSLLGGYKHHIQQLAPQYGIDPDNLAKNIPIAS